MIIENKELIKKIRKELKNIKEDFPNEYKLISYKNSLGRFYNIISIEEGYKIYVYGSSTIFNKEHKNKYYKIFELVKRYNL